MTDRRIEEIGVLAALAGAPAGLDGASLLAQLAGADVDGERALSAVEALVGEGAVRVSGAHFELTSEGARALLDVHAEIERALDPSPTTPGMEECPSIPWLTTVQTHWIDAVSLNYAVAPERLAAILPPPLEPEVHKGSAWVQVLASRLREMRPQGAPPLFGVNFHQVSYRAAVRYRGAAGLPRRGGYFVRSETDSTVMRTVGNALVEFKFHQFGLSDVTLERRGDSLEFLVDPREGEAHGAVRVELDVGAGHAAGARSVWRDCDELQEALVECYDAFGVDPRGWVYVLTIDREPWRAVFARPKRVEVEWLERGPLAGARLDSVLHIPAPCGYKWRPLRRERFVP